MKIETLVVKLLVGIVTVIILTSNGFSGTINLGFMVGEVLIVRGGKYIPVNIGMNIIRDDVIITKQASIAELQDESGTIIRIFENSKVKVTFDGENETVSLINGVIKAKIGKLQKGSERKIYTPTTVCAVRGTEFSVAVSDSSASRVNMEQGTVMLRNPYAEVVVKDDEQAYIGLASKPSIEQDPINPEVWKQREDKMFFEQPQLSVEKYEQYIKLLDQRSAGQKEEIANIRKMAMKRNVRNIEAALERVETISSSIVDDYNLGDCAQESVEYVLDVYKDKQNEIILNYSRLKEQLNKVVYQQKVNYEAIMAIKQEYRKQYEQIKKEHEKSKQKIKQEVDALRK